MKHRLEISSLEPLFIALNYQALAPNLTKLRTLHKHSLDVELCPCCCDAQYPFTAAAAAALLAVVNLFSGQQTI